MIPQSFIQELLARVDIVDVIERHIKLRKAGANYAACCPFHNEKTPSFTVSPTKQFYHCFGCGAHGSAIGFVMQYQGLGFVEAVEDLAASVGLQVPRERRESPAVVAEKVSLTDVMARAARFYRDQLKHAPKAIEYLKARGLTGEIAARFGIGYAPEDWHGLKQAFPNYDDPALREAGLVIENEEGRRYDRFRDRVMFPIVDARGATIGFGGRVIGSGEPKYLNSPETPLFEKGRELYGLPQARAAIRDTDAVIVVEGYMDVVALAQHAVENAVATLGTATTGQHVQKLMRLANRIVFCFDGDAAGRKAAWRALEASLEHLADNKTAAFLFLPPEHDPDSFVRAQGAEAYHQAAQRAMPLTEFLLRELKSRVDLKSAEGRSRLVFDAKPLLAKLRAPLLRLQLVKAVADAALLAPGEIERLCDLTPFLGEYGPRGRAPRPARRAPPSLSRTLLKILLHKPDWSARLPLELLPNAGPEDRALTALVDAVDHGELPSGGIGTVIEFFRGSTHERLLDAVLGELVSENPDETAMETVFEDTLERLRHTGLSQEIAALNAKERASGLSPEERRRLAQLLVQKQKAASQSRTSDL